MKATGGNNRVVVDASIVIDLFAGRDKAKVGAAERIFECLKTRASSVKVFVPRLCLAKVSGVLVRFLQPSQVRSVIQRLEREIVTVGDDLHYRESIKVALKTGSRGADTLLHRASKDPRCSTHY